MIDDNQTRSEAYRNGLTIRREVLGDDYVDRAAAAATPFTQPMQDLVNEYCWGGVWARDGLPRKTRSLLNIAILTVLNRNHELRTHVRGALNNGATPEEIQEVLLQTAIYAGVPAALESFRVAGEVIDAGE